MSDLNYTQLFEPFPFMDKQKIYEGLLSLVKTNSGVGFSNHDQGHLAYRAGRDGVSDEKSGDSPENNHMFQMMQTLSISLNQAALDGTSEISEMVFTWADFCILATDAYDKAKSNDVK